MGLDLRVGGGIEHLTVLIIYLWSTSGLVVPKTASDHHRMLLHYTDLNAQKLQVDGWDGMG